MAKIKRDKIEWKRVKYLKEPLTASPEHATWKYEFWLNEPLASWDVFDYWEKERIASMEQNLLWGDVLFDVGTEQGWCNLAYAVIVGPKNMVLIEPTREFWPNIRALWETNFDKTPLAFYDGLFSNKTDDKRRDNRNFMRWWPNSSEGDLIDKNKYQYIHDNPDRIPQMKIDDFVELSGYVPNALTIDVEGAELLVLKGAKKVLSEHKPKLFLSIHPDLGERDYNVKPEQVHQFLKELGYVGQHLATDHEQHYYFAVPQ